MKKGSNTKTWLLFGMTIGVEVGTMRMERTCGLLPGLEDPGKLRVRSCGKCTTA